MKRGRDKHSHDKNGSGLQDKRSPLKKMNQGQFRFSLGYFIATLLFIVLFNSLLDGSRKSVIVDFSEFRRLIENDRITRVELGPSVYRGFAESESAEPIVYRTFKVEDPDFISLLEKKGVSYYAVTGQENGFLYHLLTWIMPFIFVLILWRMLFQKMGRPDVLSFGKKKSYIVAEQDTRVRFSDVAGAEEAKQELIEVVDFLSNSERYEKIGGKVPKGVLMVGSPGTGKTLLARAVAGEAGVPFFRMSGADFVEMFVGVGAARVRDLFRQAREKAPCIIFIDELDAIGKSRAQTINSNDEREQTLNQLLVEMDGFDSRSGVIVLAATNRPEILDPALMRPGRFDRQVVIDKPDLQERKAILEKHSEGVSLDSSVNLETVARATPGLAGADLANIVNEAALLAVRAGHNKVSQSDFEEAIEKAVAGLQRKSRLIDSQEKRRVAYHEAGHALMSLLRPHTDTVHKVSIVPRGIGALGYTLQLPSEERFLLTEEELLARVDVLLAGRAAEELIFGNISTGASDDISRATDIVRRMFTDYGMSKDFRHVSLPFRKETRFSGEQLSTAGREYSEDTQNYLDREISRMIRQQYDATLNDLVNNRSALEGIAEKLLRKEVLDRRELETLADKYSVTLSRE